MSNQNEPIELIMVGIDQVPVPLSDLLTVLREHGVTRFDLGDLTIELAAAVSAPATIKSEPYSHDEILFAAAEGFPLPGEEAKPNG